MNFYSFRTCPEITVLLDMGPPTLVGFTIFYISKVQNYCMLLNILLRAVYM